MEQVSKYKQTSGHSTHKCNIQPPSRNHGCRAKTVSIIYSECVFVALVTQHAMRMRRIVLSSITCLSLP